MRRRRFIATLGGAAAVSAAGLCARQWQRDDRADALTVETLAAPGSRDGTVTVPPDDGPLVLEFFATTCSVCADQMSVLAAADRRLDGSVPFLSVTGEPVGLSVSRADVQEWWRSHGGTWPVGLDDGTALARRYDATRVPTTVVLDSDGTVTWRHGGRFDAAALVEATSAVTDR